MKKITIMPGEKFYAAAKIRSHNVTPSDIYKEPFNTCEEAWQAVKPFWYWSDGAGVFIKRDGKWIQIAEDGGEYWVLSMWDDDKLIYDCCQEIKKWYELEES